MNPETKKKALRMLTYGMYIVTSSDGAEIAAGAMNWLSQASFQPPLVMVGIRADSHLHHLVKTTGILGVNILAEDQMVVNTRHNNSRATPAGAASYRG
jgi:flavin reductase (DIM6/NTAB) family NADH-FMN oxidoreductase RutF